MIPYEKSYISLQLRTLYRSKKGKGSEPQPVAEGKGMDTKDLRS